MSAWGWVGAAVIAWCLIGVVLTIYTTTKVMTSADIEAVQDVIIGDTTLTRRHASIIMGVMGTIAWPLTTFGLVAMKRGRPESGTGDDDDGVLITPDES